MKVVDKNMALTSMLVVGVFLLVLPTEGSLTNFYNKFTLSKRLVGHTLYNMTVRGPQHCIEECVTRKLCESINFNKYLHLCELRTSTAGRFPGEYVHDPSFDYLDISAISYVSMKITVIKTGGNRQIKDRCLNFLYLFEVWSTISEKSVEYSRDMTFFSSNKWKARYFLYFPLSLFEHQCFAVKINNLRTNHVTFTFWNSFETYNSLRLALISGMIVDFQKFCKG